MVECIVRLIWATGILVASFWQGTPPLEWGWRLALALASYAGIAYWLQTRGKMNQGFAGLVAVMDSAVIAVLLGLSGSLEYYSFFVLAPCAFAAAKHGANAAAMAPLATSFLLVAANLAPGPVNQTLVLVQALGILAVGLLLNMGQVVVTVEERIEIPVPAAMAPSNTDEPDRKFLLLRENYRELREQTLKLERTAKRDSLVASLVTVLQEQGDAMLSRLAAKLRELTACEGVVVYTPASMADSLVARVTSGEVPKNLDIRAVEISGVHNDSLLKRRIDNLFQTLREEDRSAQRAGYVVLRDQGQVLAVVALVDRDAETVHDAVGLLERLTTPLVAVLRQERDQTSQERRLRQAELLYAVSSVAAGAETPTNLAARVVRDIWESVPLDHLSTIILDGENVITAARQGSTGTIVDELMFPEGRGIAGWLASGAPEVVIFDTGEDVRVDRTEALRRRIGSFLMMPMLFGMKPYGCVIAATHQAGGLDTTEIDYLRTVTAEMTQAMARLEEVEPGPNGIMTPAEFMRSVEGLQGSFVLIEPLKREELEQEFGRPAIEMMMRNLTRRIRQRLPINAQMCRRAEGDFIVFVSGVSEEFCRSWANDAITHASMMGLTTPDGRRKIPVAMRAKVSSASRFAETGLAA
ncbi:MAG: GAF domain-containing protein [Chthonomonas sp.]|nr:GAF domain-containing protein [Chthonomonas sp.]